MLFRTIIAAVAAMGLATAVFATEETTTTTNTETTQAVNSDAAPAPGDVTKTVASETTTTTTEKVNINTATAKELMKVHGINSSKAHAIVTYRKKHGEFKSLDDLKSVKGFKKIDDQKMKDLEDQLTAG